MRSNQYGFVNFGTMTLLVGGCALAGLLLYGWRSGQELPLWPALAVVGVNIAAAVKIAMDSKKKAQQRPANQNADTSK